MQHSIIKLYYERYYEIKENPYLGVTVYNKKPSLKDEITWFDSVIKQVRKGNTIFLVALADGKLIGTCTVKSGAEAETNHIGTVGISLTKNYRGMGIGAKLLDNAIKMSKKRFRLLVLSVFETNSNAVHLYEKMGFKKYGVLPNGIKRGRLSINHIFMYLKL